MKMSLYVAFLRCLYLLYQNCHWQTKNYSLHLLFERLYTEVQIDADKAAEKSIGLFFSEVLDLTEQSKYFAKILPQYAKKEFVATCLAAEEDFRKIVEEIKEDLKSNNKLTPGLDNMIMDHCDNSENRCYLLKQNI